MGQDRYLTPQGAITNRSRRQRALDEMQTRVEIRPGHIALVKAAPIDARVVARHRMLMAAQSDAASSLEEWIVELGIEDDDDFVSSWVRPFWADFDDLHFAQVLFLEALMDVGGGPWEDSAPERVASRSDFLRNVRVWAKPDPDEKLTARDRAQNKLDAKAWLAAARAAIRLDVDALRAIVSSVRERWEAELAYRPRSAYDKRIERERLETEKLAERIQSRWKGRVDVSIEGAAAAFKKERAEVQRALEKLCGDGRARKRWHPRHDWLIVYSFAPFKKRRFNR